MLKPMQKSNDLQKMIQWCEEHLGETYFPDGDHEQQLKSYHLILENYHDVFCKAIEQGKTSIEGQPLFWYGINHGYLNPIKRLNVDLNAAFINDLAPIHLAAFYGYWKTFLWLLSQRVRLDLKDQDEQNVLHHALFLSHFSRPEMQEIKKMMALQLIQLCPELLTQKNTSGTTPIHLMASNEVFSDILQSILKKNPELQQLKDHFGHHPIHLALMNAPKIANWMLENDEVNHIMSSHQQYPIHFAAINGDLNLLKKCCEHIDINLTNSELKTPLILAAEFNHRDLVDYLIKQGAITHYKDFQNKTYLDYLSSISLKPR